MLQTIISVEGFHTFLLVLQVLVASGLIGFILIQHGKGADAGAAFGSGASSTVFGARGSGNFLTKTTSILAFVFLTNSLLLAYIAVDRISRQQSVMQTEEVMVQQKQEITVPESGNDVPAVPESEIPALPGE